MQYEVIRLPSPRLHQDFLKLTCKEASVSPEVKE